MLAIVGVVLFAPFFHSVAFWFALVPAVMLPSPIPLLGAIYLGLPLTVSGSALMIILALALRQKLLWASKAEWLIIGGVSGAFLGFVFFGVVMKDYSYMWAGHCFFPGAAGALIFRNLLISRRQRKMIFEYRKKVGL